MRAWLSKEVQDGLCSSIEPELERSEKPIIDMYASAPALFGFVLSAISKVRL